MSHRPDRLLAAAAMLAALRAAAPHRRRDSIHRLDLTIAGAFEDAGIEGFLDGLEGLAPPEPRPSPDALGRLLDRIEKGGPGALGTLYMSMTPRARRHGSGEYYTPGWLVEHVLDRTGFHSGSRLVDPMCGAGAFLTAAIARLRRERPGIAARDIADRVQGFDLHPLAVLLARAAYVMALGPPGGAPIRIPVARADALSLPPVDPAFDVVVGNPPWVGWENLEPAFREKTRHLWEYHGLFERRGRRGPGAMESLLGGGKKDLCMLATYAAAETLLKRGGRLCFVIAQGVFKSAGSGAGFRRFALGDGTTLRVVGVDDFSALAAFPGTGARACVMTLEKGGPTAYPVPWRVFDRAGAEPREEIAEPIDALDPRSAWVTGAAASIRSIRRAAGASSWRARAGAYTGGANGVFWVEVLERRADGTCLVRNIPGAGKRSVPDVTALVEDDLLHPLLRASDVRRLRATPSAWILLTQDPARRRGIDETTMASRYPLALAYLERFREPLAARRDRGTRSLVDGGAPWWSVFSVSSETLSPWKVVWRRIATRVEAAAVGPARARIAAGALPARALPVVPQETCTFVACASEEEACFLAGLLNTTRFNDAARALGQVGAKGFAAPRLLRYINVPRYEPGDASHRALALRVGDRRGAPAQDELDALGEAAWPLAQPAQRNAGPRRSVNATETIDARQEPRGSRARPGRRERR